LFHILHFFFFFSSRRRHTRFSRDWSSDVCSSDLFQNISMKNIYVSGSGIAGFFMGLPEMKLKNVILENSVLEAEKGITAIDASRSEERRVGKECRSRGSRDQ